MKQLNYKFKLNQQSLKTKANSGIQAYKIRLEVTGIFTKRIDLVFKHGLEISIKAFPERVFKTQTDITTKMYAV